MHFDHADALEVELLEEQYKKTVRPMHLVFVEGSRSYPDIIIPEGCRNQVAIDLLISRLRLVGRGPGPRATEEPLPDRPPPLSQNGG